MTHVCSHVGWLQAAGDSGAVVHREHHQHRDAAGGVHVRGAPARGAHGAERAHTGAGASVGRPSEAALEEQCAPAHCIAAPVPLHPLPSTPQTQLNFGYSVICGLAAAMETCCGQAFGAGHYKLLGQVLQASGAQGGCARQRAPLRPESALLKGGPGKALPSSTCAGCLRVARTTGRPGCPSPSSLRLTGCPGAVPAVVAADCGAVGQWRHGLRAGGAGPGAQGGARCRRPVAAHVAAAAAAGTGGDVKPM